jgi:uncharacterized membrane protein
MRRKRQSPIPPPLPVRVAKLHAKLAFAVLVGIAFAALLTLTALHWPTCVLIGWDVGVATYLALTYAMMWRAEVSHILQRAAEQDEGAVFILLLSIVATFASLAAIIGALGSAEQAAASTNAGAVVTMAIVTILLSWFFVHTMFSLHYAHEYYDERGDGKIGGIEFPRDTKPDYRDFLYFSLVIGMTSQTSDAAISSKVIRRFAAMQGVLSFFFNLVVLALTVNMVSNLIKPG